MECFVEQVQIVGRTNEFGKTGGGRNGVFCLELNLCLLYTSAFGSDKYYTIGSLGTINGCCSGILQNRKRFDFVGFNITHASGYTVHKYQWRCTTRKGTYASNPNSALSYPGSPERCTAIKPATCPARLLFRLREGTTISFGLMELIETTTLSFFCCP